MSAITLFTATGRALLAAAVANGQALASAKIAVGDGNGQVYVPNESQTTLVHEVWRGLASVARTDDLVVFRATIPANVGDFIVRELGLYLGPVGAEQLFIISQSPSREKIATPANGGGPMEVSVHFSANAAQVAVLPAGSSGTAVLQLQNAPHITVDGIITAPPANPADGMLYAIDTGASGTFTGQAGNLVERVAGAWVFRPMRNYSIIRDASNGTWFERNGADWVTYTFNDTSVAWTEITGRPTEFPPATHNHDDRYFTETEADGRFVRTNPPGGASQTIAGPLMIIGSVGGNGAAITAAGWHAYSANGSLGAAFSANLNGSEVVRFGCQNGWVGIECYYGWPMVFKTASIERMRVDANGNVGIGVTIPAEKLDVGGTVKAARITGLAAVDFLAAGVSTWTAYQDANTWILHNYTLAGTKISVNKEGDLSIARAVNVSNWVGYNGMVLRSQGAGQPSQWSSMADIQPILDYRHMETPSASNWYPSASAAWVAMPLNTMATNAIPGAAGNAGVVTLPAGTYEIDGSISGIGAGGGHHWWQGRIRNRTAGTTIIAMSAQYSTEYPLVTTGAAGKTRITLAAAAEIAIEIFTDSAIPGGFRNTSGTGENIMFAQLIITKIG